MSDVISGNAATLHLHSTLDDVDWVILMISGVIYLILHGRIHLILSELEDRNMPADYVILAVVAVLGTSGGLFLLSQAKSYRNRRHSEAKHIPHQPAH